MNGWTPDLARSTGRAATLMLRASEFCGSQDAQGQERFQESMDGSRDALLAAKEFGTS